MHSFLSLHAMPKHVHTLKFPSILPPIISTSSAISCLHLVRLTVTLVPCLDLERESKLSGGTGKSFSQPRQSTYERSFATAEKSLNAYNCTSDVALTEFPPTYLTRLSLTLNFSMFYYEILNSPDHACSSYLPHTPGTRRLTQYLPSLPPASFKFFSLLIHFETKQTHQHLELLGRV